jgi:dihydropteroate synthase
MRLGSTELDLTRRIAVMAIVNRTPDSFYDRGATFDLAVALEHAAWQVEAGADIVDVGGVKAGPGSFVGVDEELDRVVPFVEAFVARHDVAVSVDTWRAEVARGAIAAGATLVNDVTGLCEPEVADVVAAHPHVGLVLTFHGGAPRTRPWRPDFDPDVVTVARRRCAELVGIAVERGVAATQLVVDPGHDMGKTTMQSLALLRHLDELAALGHPVLVALSNKDFVGEAVGRPLAERGPASLAAAVLAIERGARIVRVHDAATAVPAMRMVEVTLGWRTPAVLLRGLD